MSSNKRGEGKAVFADTSWPGKLDQFTAAIAGYSRKASAQFLIELDPRVKEPCRKQWMVFERDFAESSRRYRAQLGLTDDDRAILGDELDEDCYALIDAEERRDVVILYITYTLPFQEALKDYLAGLVVYLEHPRVCRAKQRKQEVSNGIQGPRTT